MTQIYKINQGSYVSELETVCTMFFVETQKQDYSNDAYFFNLLLQGGKLCKELSISIHRSKTLSALKLKGERRKENFRKLTHAVEGYTFHPTEDVSTAASQVLKVISNFGLKITRDNYSKQSAEFKTLIGNLTDEQTTESTQKLDGIEKLIQNLIESQKSFMDYWQEFQNIQIEEKKLETATELKSELLGIMNKQIIPYLNSMKVSQPALYGKLGESIEKIIHDHNAKVKARIKRIKEKNRES